MLSSRGTPAPFRIRNIATVIKAMALTALPLCLAACQSAAPNEGAMLQPAAAIISNDSNAFIGLDDLALANALGKPQMVRKEMPAEVWQYGGADCVVDFYLYERDGRLEVAYVEARDMRAGSASTDRCVNSLLQWVSAAGASRAL
jgi:hypothetical protein